MRKKIVAGNWKMNKTLNEAQSLVTNLVEALSGEPDTGTEVVICPPFPYFSAINPILSRSRRITLGAQNVHQKAEGAYTGEISAPMLASMGVPYVIVGHSERRQYFGETNQIVAEKVDAALASGLRPIFCCGESRDQREAGGYMDFVKGQLSESLFHLKPEAFKEVVIAYEPIWAIGTGLTASSAQAQEMHQALRHHISSKYGDNIADATSILYGGSVNAVNAKELFAQPDVDGGLVGGASLKAPEFAVIVKSAQAD